MRESGDTGQYGMDDCTEAGQRKGLMVAVP